jgi:hypothetical protein
MACNGTALLYLLILYLGTRWGWVVSITLRSRFTPGERTLPGTQWIGGWVGLRAGLDTEATVKKSCLCRGSNTGRSLQSDTTLTELTQLTRSTHKVTQTNSTSILEVGLTLHQVVFTRARHAWLRSLLRASGYYVGLCCSDFSVVSYCN